MQFQAKEKIRKKNQASMHDFQFDTQKQKIKL